MPSNSLECFRCIGNFQVSQAILFKRFYLFSERGEGKGKEGEKYQRAGCLPGELGPQPSRCPDQDLNQGPGSQPMFNPLSYRSQGSRVILKCSQGRGDSRSGGHTNMLF